MDYTDSIKLSLSIGLGGNHVEVVRISDYFDPDEWDKIQTGGHVEMDEAIQDILNQWAGNYIDTGFECIKSDS
jgi:hypothetical protein